MSTGRSRSGKGEMSSPRPSPSADPPRRKNATSEPNSDARAVRPERFNPQSHNWFNPSRATAAFPDPPPLQEPGGAADQVLRTRRRGAAMNLNSNLRIRGGPQDQLVLQVQHLEDGSQLVKPVLPKTQNLQDPVRLGKGGESK